MCAFERKPHLFFLNFDVSDCIYWIMNATVFLLVDKKRALQTSIKECIYTRLVWYVIYTVFLLKYYHVSLSSYLDMHASKLNIHAHCYDIFLSVHNEQRH